MNTADVDYQRNAFKNMAKSMSRSQVESFSLSYAEKEGIQIFRKNAVDEILRITKPADIVPVVYEDFRKIVEDGIRFLLMRISLNRLIQLSVDQLLAAESCGIEERLILLAKRIPTLHKLGQVIARNPHIDSSFKEWLIQLEHGYQGTQVEDVRSRIETELKEDISAYDIQMEDQIHFEASVGATVVFTWVDQLSQRPSKGIFKVLKPNVQEYVKEELEILDHLAQFFEDNRMKYPLKRFRFKETFAEIRDALLEEINLSGEQVHLRKARGFYLEDSDAHIPAVLPFSSRHVTAMEFMEGMRITDIHLTDSNRRQLAHSLFNAVFWTPLFSFKEQTIFHGDPHAGNIYAFPSKTRDEFEIALLDWSLSGELSRDQRVWIFKLIIGVMAMDEDLIAESIDHLSKDQHMAYGNRLKSIIPSILSRKDYQNASLIKKTFTFIDQTALNGIQYSKDIMLLRKSVFTLEGVLHDIDPCFNMDIAIFRMLTSLCLEEMPKRWTQMLFSLPESSVNYKSLMSNSDISSLVSGILSKKVRKSIESAVRMGLFLWMNEGEKKWLPEFS